MQRKEEVGLDDAALSRLRRW